MSLFGVGWFLSDRRRGFRCPQAILGFALCLLSRLMHDVEGGECIISQSWTMFLPCRAHIPCLSTEFFIPSCSSHSCGCNAHDFVSNGAVLTELFTNYYASRAEPAPAIKTNRFWKKKRVRAL